MSLHLQRSLCLAGYAAFTCEVAVLCRGMKSVVFVLDELDLFAQKARQTLLYNLLDALQAADMQASLRTRVDPDHVRFLCAPTVHGQLPVIRCQLTP